VFSMTQHRDMSCWLLPAEGSQQQHTFGAPFLWLLVLAVRVLLQQSGSHASAMCGQGCPRAVLTQCIRCQCA